MTSTFYQRTKILVLSLLIPIASGSPFAAANADVQKGDRISNGHIFSEGEILNAKELLMSVGVPGRNLCRIDLFTNREDFAENKNILSVLPLCDEDFLGFEMSNNMGGFNVGAHPRILEEEDDEPTFQEDPVLFFVMGSCALFCVILAALAAGLTMGMLSLDPLMLLVKIRASRSPEKRQQAEDLLPIVKQHHLLLVTLLLLNSLANEALPLFLEKLVSPVISVLLSVSFVLIFGEILPSAVFTGPKKIELASKMVPLVKVIMTLFSPITYPIAKVLDKFLHEGDDDDGDFHRGEISALVRIQYERIAHKRQRKLERMKSTVVKSSASFPHPKPRAPDVEAVLKTAKFESKRNLSKGDILDPADISALKDIASIHVDEVAMVEGALQMKTKTAFDVFTPIHRLFAVPDNLILNEDNVVDIYSSGFSRIPVYEQNQRKPKSQTAIKGVLNTKKLIVVNMNENRPLSTMPLLTPPCISPKMNLVELVNLFQTGRYGHFGLVCARPHIGTEALKGGSAVPATAGVMGIVTLEDVLEELLQEEIFDENDRMEKEAERIALWVGRKWKRKKEHRSMASVVLKAQMENESTFLIGTRETVQERPKRGSSIFGIMFQGFGFNSGND